MSPVAREPVGAPRRGSVIDGTLLAGRYRLGRLLGAGGMGHVHAAWDGLLSREVAMRFLREADARDQELVQRFRREARSNGSLSHPNIVQVFDAGYTEGAHERIPYIAMELVLGGTLKDRIRGGGPLAPGEAARVALEVGGALGDAHDRGSSTATSNSRTSSSASGGKPRSRTSASPGWPRRRP